VDDLAGLLWAANLASIELHPLLSMSERPGEAPVVVLDLDPGPGASIFTCARVASRVRETLAGMDLAAFPKTSGSVGMHVYLPVNSGAGFEATRAFARKLARSLSQRYPDAVTDRIDARARVGKVLIDWRQNGPNASTVAPYSLRAMPWPTASTPLTWEEVDAIGGDDATALPVDAEEVLRRLDSCGDLFSPVLHLRQELPSL
jgi:bifunctional non-homologous end joining protein LigD